MKGIALSSFGSREISSVLKLPGNYIRQYTIHLCLWHFSCSYRLEKIAANLKLLVLKPYWYLVEISFSKMCSQLGQYWEMFYSHKSVRTRVQKWSGIIGVSNLTWDVSEPFNEMICSEIKSEAQDTNMIQVIWLFYLYFLHSDTFDSHTLPLKAFR